MARLYKSLHQSNPQPSPVFLLSMQYRMHPDICEFPSKYIYNNTLKNDWYASTHLCQQLVCIERESERGMRIFFVASDYSPLYDVTMCRQGQCRQYEKEESALTRAELGLIRFLSGPCQWWVHNTVNTANWGWSPPRWLKPRLRLVCTGCEYALTPNLVCYEKHSLN